jgi:hypothetical protein
MVDLSNEQRDLIGQKDNNATPIFKFIGIKEKLVLKQKY